MNGDFQRLCKLLLNDKPEKSDAVIWLQGDRYDRAKNVLQIYRLKLARVIVISGNNILVGPHVRPGENNICLVDMSNYLIKNGVNEHDIVVDDKAFNTKDQAIHVTKLAERRKWKKIILVSSSYNQPRALLTFLKEIKSNSGNIRIYNYPVVMNFDEIPDGRIESVNKLYLDEIDKIAKYKNDLLSIQLGIEYMINTKL